MAWLMAANLVSELLNFEQKQRHIDIAQYMLRTFNDDLDLDQKVITSDESWVYLFDIEIKVQS